MKTAPLISILIPVYNTEKYIREALESIVSQTYSRIEICVCDDASTDRSADIVKSFSDDRIRMVENHQNIGYLRTMNKLMGMAKGDFFAFQDADDVSHPQRLEIQLKFLLENPMINLVGCNFNIIDPQGAVIHRDQRVESDPHKINQQLTISNPFQKPSVMFHRKIYTEIGGFREEFLKLKNISEDYDWLVRASEKFLLSNINHSSPLYAYRSVPTAMTKNFENTEQVFGHKIVQYLALQRNSGNLDSLQQKDWAALVHIIDALKKPYENDPSLFYFEKAEALMYAGLYNYALKCAWRALAIHPLKIRNLKCIASALKRSLQTFKG